MMQPSDIEMANAIVKDGGAVLLFGLALAALEFVGLVLLLFGVLMFRGVWRWLTRATWNDVVLSASRKALR